MPWFCLRELVIKIGKHTFKGDNAMCKFENKVIKKIERKVMPYVKQRLNQVVKHPCFKKSATRELHNKLKQLSVDEMKTIDSYITSTNNALRNDITLDVNQKVQETIAVIEAEQAPYLKRISQLGLPTFLEEALEEVENSVRETSIEKTTQSEETYIKAVKNCVDLEVNQLIEKLDATAQRENEVDQDWKKGLVKIEIDPDNPVDLEKLRPENLLRTIMRLSEVD